MTARWSAHLLSRALRCHLWPKNEPHHQPEESCVGVSVVIGTRHVGVQQSPKRIRHQRGVTRHVSRHRFVSRGIVPLLVHLQRQHLGDVVCGWRAAGHVNASGDARQVGSWHDVQDRALIC